MVSEKLWEYYENHLKHMKWKSNYSKRYLPARSLIFAVPGYMSGSGFNMNMIFLIRPEVRLIWEENRLEVIQKISNELQEQEIFIMNSLEKEAHRLFDGLGLGRIKIILEYE